MKRKLLFDPILNKLSSHPVEPKPEGLVTSVNGILPDAGGNVLLPLERSGWMEIPSGKNVVTFMVKNGPGLYLCNPRSTYTGGLPEGQKFEIARTSYSTFLFITYRLSKMPAYYDYSSTEVYADLWLQMADLTANGYMAMAAWRGVACNEFFLTQANVSWRQVIDYDGEVFIRNDVRLEGNPMVEDLPADFDQLPEYFQNNRIVNKKYVDGAIGTINNILNGDTVKEFKGAIYFYFSGGRRVPDGVYFCLPNSGVLGQLPFKPLEEAFETCCLFFHVKNFSFINSEGVREFFKREVTCRFGYNTRVNDFREWKAIFLQVGFSGWKQVLDIDGSPITAHPIRNEDFKSGYNIRGFSELYEELSTFLFRSSDVIVEGAIKDNIIGACRLLVTPNDDSGAYIYLGLQPETPEFYISLSGAKFRMTRNGQGNVRLELNPTIWSAAALAILKSTTIIIDKIAIEGIAEDLVTPTVTEKILVYTQATSISSFDFTNN